MKTTSKDKPIPFIFHFHRRIDSTRIAWKITHNDKEEIVDEIDVKVPCTTFERDISPRAVMIGIGTIRFEYIKEDGYKKIKAIIE